jgi:lipoate-protein ligase B
MFLIEFDLLDYSASLEIQHKIVERKIRERGPDVLLLLEHPPTITLGHRGNLSDVLASSEELRRLGISVFETDRGGLATYHGPGQLICYPIMDLRAGRLSVSEYVRSLEQVIIYALKKFDIAGLRLAGKVGVWTSDTDKIASIGVKIRQRVSFHGFSLNVDLRHDPSKFMISCGMDDVRMISMRDLIDGPIEMKAVRQAVTKAFSQLFETDLIPTAPEEVV